MRRAKRHLLSRILVPTDGSREAVEAVDYAVELALSFGAGVTLVHVVEGVRLPLYVPGVYPSDRDRHRLALLEGGKAILESARMRALKAGIAVVTVLQEGSPGDVIVDLAAQGNFDLIVIGRRGLGLARSLLIGSVSDYVARNAPCPVLIVRGEWKGKSALETEAGAS